MNPNESELLAAVSRITALFDALGVDYFIGGSVASSLFGEPRQTLDADIVARILGTQAPQIAAELSSDFYVELESILQAIEAQGSFNLIHLESMTKVDVFIRWRTPFAQSQFQRRQSKLLGAGNPLKLFFASPEDIVLAKLEWYRKGGETSDRQWRDLLGVLKVQAGRIDTSYLAQWAAEIGVSDLLKRALVQAGIQQP